MSTFFDEIEDLRDLAVAVDNEYSRQQLVKFRIHIIKNTWEFEYELRIWYGLARSERTWDDFKTYFEAAHIILKTTRGKTMQSSSFHQANMLVEQIRTEIQSIQSSVLQALDNKNQENEQST